MSVHALQAGTCWPPGAGGPPARRPAVLRRSTAAVATAALLPVLLMAPPLDAQPADLRLYGAVDLNLTKFARQRPELTQSSTSRLGVRGREPLGDGLSAQFQLESEVRPDTGTTASRFWGRESWVGLGHRWGTLRLGRSRTPLQRLVSEFDPHGTDGIGSFGNSGLLLGHGGLARFENALYLDSATLAGWSAALAIQFDETANGRDDQWRAWRMRYAANRASGAWVLSVGAAELAAGDRVTSVGLSWAVGGFIAHVQAHRGERAGYARGTWLAGFEWRFGQGLLRAAASHSGERRVGAERRALVAIGWDRALSVRTTLYGTLARDRLAAKPPALGIEAGIRHRF